MIFETFPKVFKFFIRGLSNIVTSYGKFQNNSSNISPHLNFDINTQFLLRRVKRSARRILMSDVKTQTSLENPQ